MDRIVRNLSGRTVTVGVGTVPKPGYVAMTPWNLKQAGHAREDPSQSCTEPRTYPADSSREVECPRYRLTSRRMGSRMI